MPKGYIIAHVTITNAEKFEADYASKAGAIVEQYEGRFLVRGGPVSFREGDTADLDVVVEFPSVEKAEAFANSIEYNAIVADRKNNSTGSFIIVEGA
jgi:uncharacterized protein (DUF1330 family)